jgi:hypothetical protein
MTLSLWMLYQKKRVQASWKKRERLEDEDNCKPMDEESRTEEDSD